MILIVDGEIIDSSKEKEMLFTEDWGVCATVIFKNNSIEQKNNLTEIHNRYPSVFGEKIAFESDWHQTGGTRDIEAIRTVVIYKAEDLMDEPGETYNLK